MRNYRPALSQSMFDVFETSPGRVDPKTGRLVESTAVPAGEREGFFDFVEVSPGRVDPRTGRLVRSTRGPRASEEIDLPRRRRDFEGGSRSPYPRLREGFSPMGPSYLSGPGTVDSILKNPATWIVVGFSTLLALEAFGVTNLFQSQPQP